MFKENYVMLMYEKANVFIRMINHVSSLQKRIRIMHYYAHFYFWIKNTQQH